MTSARRRITLVLSILGLLALPSLAFASVGGQLSKASTALQNAVAAADVTEGVGAFKANMNAAHGHTARAERVARKAKGKAKRAKLMRRVAAQYDTNLDQYANLIGSVAPSLQVPLVAAVGISADARADAVEFLTRIAGHLQEPARSAVLSAVAAFETDGDLTALLEALASDDVVTYAKGMLLVHIETISSQVGSLLGQLESLTSMLPPGAADAVGQAIAMIHAHIGELGTLIEGLFSEAQGGRFGFAGLGSLCDLLARLPIPVSICD